MKLISMTDFVLEQDEKYLKGFMSLTEFNSLARNYANFLKQPLTLSMFVPCGDDGEVLENPRADDNDAGTEKELLQIAYNNAKNRCLFEGFEVKRTHNLDTENPCYVVSNGENEVTFHIGLYNFSKGVQFAKTIEDLSPISPTLAQSAINQITTTR